MKIPALAAFAAVCVILTPTTQAQEDEDRYIEEVIVTATKRAESIQEVPIAVTALSAETLERAGVKDLRDLSQVAASFNLNSSQTESQGTTLRIRGVGTTGNNIGLESAVGVFIDGVYISRPGVALGDLLDVEQIEVLRGPQGTLFGRNTSAGALNITTRKPNFEETEFFANFSAQNFSGTNLQAGVSGPIVQDKLAYRISGAIREQDGFAESVTSGEESRNRDRYLLRAQLQWNISERADLRIIADYSDADEQCCDAAILTDTPLVDLGLFPLVGLPADGGVPAVGFGAAEDFDTNSEGFDNPFEQRGISAELNVDINDNITLTYIGSWRDFLADSIQNSDFTGLDIFEVAPSAANGFFGTFDDIRTITHEIRLAGSTDRISWLVGGYYSDETIQENAGLFLGTEFAPLFDLLIFTGGFGGLGLDDAGLAALGAVPLSGGLTFGDVLAAPSPTVAFAGGNNPAGSFANNIFRQDGSSWSVFTHNTFGLTEKLDFVLGLRFTNEEKDGSFVQPDAFNAACPAGAVNSATFAANVAGTPFEGLEALTGGLVGGLCFPFANVADSFPGAPETFSDTFEDEELVWTTKFVYTFNDNINAYASFTHGFKAGGFNLDSTAASNGADPRFDSELIDAFELGLKSDWFDRRLRANIALFDYDIENFQVLEFTGVQFQTFNVPDAESSGIEVELSGQPTAGLNLALAYTLANSEYPSDCNDGLDPNATFFAAVTALCGADFTNAPENVVTFNLSYDGNITDRLSWFVNANVRWEDDRRTSTAPDLPLDVQESNTKANLRLGIGEVNGKWQAELWSNNITDEITRNVTFNVPLRAPGRGAFLEAPRTFGFTIRTQL